MAARDQTNFADGSELLSFSIDRGAPESIFRQLYGALRRLILDGIAPAGSRLPASRLVAERLGVSRASVVGVYEQLLAEGYLIGRQGAGTFVSPDMLEPLQRPPHRALARALAQASAPNRRPKPAARYAALAPDPAQFEAVPFNTGRCSLDEQTLATWRRLTAAALRRPDALWLGYGDPRGSPRLREALAHYLRASRGVQCDADQILILSGVQQAIDLVLKILIEPGDPVWIEDPTYPALHDALKAARARIVPVPVDDQGLVVANGVAASPLARAAYVTPSHQSPSGVVLSMARRLELLAWAREARAWIIEDDYDSEFRYAGRPIASLQGIDRGERVIYLGTFSKVVFPGLRLGYAVVPHELLQAMTAARHLTDRQAPAVTESVVADFIEQGHFEAHVRRMRATYRVARDQLAAALRAKLGCVLEVEVPDQGMRLLARLAPGWSDTALAKEAAARGLVLRPMSKLYLSAPPLQALLLGFTGYSLPALRAGVDRLAEVIGRRVR
ncbi:PLP-dependent aminotransferase family protein [Reyranella sp.]|uniref:MocR-like pyridoxine biosynthesis transcription factor PdxR n=1 Tax=Reyranella sp. TaxID=1929291 RepID=UPI0025F099AF|nr:PLP-dependent aminotransferase family protein [Reyranella sp.]